MNDENKDHPETAPADHRPDEESPPEAAVEDGMAIVDEPDEPIDPDDQTRAETEAARIALTPSYGRRKYRGPRSISIMLLMMACVMALGIYGIYWANNLTRSNERGKLRTLEERAYMSVWQQKFIQVRGFKPAGEEYAPLTPNEVAQMELFKTTYGPQYKPTEQQLRFLAELKPYLPATGPTTGP